MKTQTTPSATQQLKTTINGILIRKATNAYKVLCLTNHFNFLLEASRKEVRQEILKEIESMKEDMDYYVVDDVIKALKPAEEQEELDEEAKKD